MKADNNQKVLPIIYVYNVIKENKTSTIYQRNTTHNLREPKPDDQFTEIVRIEDFQGYSKARNLKYYFRLRDKTNWQKCTALTGLFRTKKTNVYFGNIKTGNIKTLILFKIDEDFNLHIYKYPKGYYLTQKGFDLLINSVE